MSSMLKNDCPKFCLTSRLNQCIMYFNFYFRRECTYVPHRKYSSEISDTIQQDLRSVLCWRGLKPRQRRADRSSSSANCVSPETINKESENETAHRFTAEV